MRVTLSIPAPETTNNTIHWPNADVMLGHCLQRWANIIPIKTFQTPIIIFKREGIFSKHLLKTKVLTLGTSNDILHMFISLELVYRDVNRFPHTAPLFRLNSTHTQAQINLISYRPTAGLNDD